MNQLIQQFFTQPLSKEELFFVELSLFFFSLGLLLILVLLISRLVKNYYATRRSRLRLEFQGILNSISIEGNQPGPAYKMRLASVHSLVNHSGFAEQVLIEQLREKKNNLTGASAQSLEEVYRALNLHLNSLRKLKSLRWRIKALGIRELAEFGCSEYSSQIAHYIHSKNQTLREESFLALVRLQKDSSLSFLDDYQGIITEWMKINIHRHLELRDSRQVPLFKKWFNHANTSVRLFSVGMAKQFRQLDSIPGLVHLLSDTKSEIVLAAADALGELQAHEAAEDLEKLIPRFLEHPSALKTIIKGLGQLGDPETQTAVISKFLDHPSSEIVFESVRALKKFGLLGQEALEHYSAKTNAMTARIIRHLSEPLLQP